MIYGDGEHNDTLAIQAMLDACGIVTIDKPGTYLISKTLIIHSNTRFILSPGAKLLAAPLSRCALIENEHFAGGGRDENIEVLHFYDRFPTKELMQSALCHAAKVARNLADEVEAKKAALAK